MVWFNAIMKVTPISFKIFKCRFAHDLLHSSMYYFVWIQSVSPFETTKPGRGVCTKSFNNKSPPFWGIANSMVCRFHVLWFIFLWFVLIMMNSSGRSGRNEYHLADIVDLENGGASPIEDVELDVVYEYFVIDEQWDSSKGTRDGIYLSACIPHWKIHTEENACNRSSSLQMRYAPCTALNTKLHALCSPGYNWNLGYPRLPYSDSVPSGLEMSCCCPRTWWHDVPGTFHWGDSIRTPKNIATTKFVIISRHKIT